MGIKISVKTLAIAALAVVAASCQKKSNSVITGKFLGGEGSMVYLEKIDPTASSIVDSVQLSNGGEFEFAIKDENLQPTLYNVVYDMEKIPLLLSKGDNISINSMGHIVNNYTISGSAESELIRQFLQPYQVSREKLEQIKNE